MTRFRVHFQGIPARAPVGSQLAAVGQTLHVLWSRRHESIEQATPCFCVLIVVKGNPTESQTEEQRKEKEGSEIHRAGLYALSDW